MNKEKIKNNFPNARDNKIFFNELLMKLESEEKINIKKSILGLSICPDEINISDISLLNKFKHSYFFLGGLAGYPFTGITGFNAFASHVPKDGNLIIVYGPHVGITQKGEVGSILRYGQEDTTSCCGALIATLNHFNREVSGKEELSENNYQADYLITKLKEGKKNIIESICPEIEITRQSYMLIHDQIQYLVKHIDPSIPIQKIILIGGIIINNDLGFTDYFDLIDYRIIRP